MPSPPPQACDGGSKNHLLRWTILPDRDRNHYGFERSPNAGQKISRPESNGKRGLDRLSDELSGKLYGFLNEKRFLSE